MRFYLLFPLAVAAFLPMVATAADNCEVSISAGDAFAYSTRSIDVPLSCEQFTVNFEHTGSLPKGGMGHNWLMTETSDMQAVVTAGAAAGLDNDFHPADESLVIAGTPLLAGGEKASVTFETSQLSADKSYSFFCSFPGHSFMMRGSVNLIK